MSHSIQTTALLSNLIEEVVGKDTLVSQKGLQSLVASACKLAKSHQYASTNHFEVHRQVEGLTEKFSVVNREDLASGLEHALLRLRKTSLKHDAEILTLLLHLSDQPAINSPKYKCQDGQGNDADGKALTWAQIRADDPLTDEGFWSNADFPPAAASESDSDWDQDEDVTTPVESPAPKPTIFSEQIELGAYYIERAQTDISIRLDASQDTWAQTSTQISVKARDLVIIRETITMLRGFPSSIFVYDQADRVTFNSAYSSHHLSQALLKGVGTEVAALGTSLRKLRTYTQKPNKDVLWQRFNEIILNRLHNFSQQLTEIEHEFLIDPQDKVVSIGQLMCEVQLRSRPLVALECFVYMVENSRDLRPFSHIEALFDTACLYQASSDDELHTFFAQVLLESLEVYLKLVLQWMHRGQLSATWDHGFFIVQNGSSVEAGTSLWHDQFSIRRDEQNRIFAPAFVHSEAVLILNAGKSVLLLEKLGIQRGLESCQSSEVDFKPLVLDNMTCALLPFKYVFETQFHYWLEQLYSSTFELLRDTLFQRFELERNLEALRQIFFARDASKYQLLTDPMFKALDIGAESWNDRHILQQRYRDTYNHSWAIVPDCIFVAPPSTHSWSRGSVQALSTISVGYRLPWPLLNVIRKSTLPMYQKINRFILQLYRAKYMVQLTMVPRGTRRANRVSVYLRQQLVSFIDALHSHVVQVVIEPLNKEMDKKMASTKSIDEMAEVHTSSIQLMMTRCLLTKGTASIHHHVMTLLDLAGRFNNLQVHMDARGAMSSRLHNVTTRRKRLVPVHGPFTGEKHNRGSETKESDYEADNEKQVVNEGPPELQLRKMKDAIVRLRHQVVSALWENSKTDGDITWEMLAERLDWDRSFNVGEVM